MSRADLQRFTEDLQADAALAEEFGLLGDDPEAWRSRAAARGYALTTDEAGGLSASHRELSDDDLENVAGGWDGSGSGGGSGGSGGG